MGMRVAVLMGVYVAVAAVVGMLVIRPAHMGMRGVVAVMVVSFVVVGNAVLMHIFVIVLVIHSQSPFQAGYSVC
jgi:hypothetical protein